MNRTQRLALLASAATIAVVSFGFGARYQADNMPHKDACIYVGSKVVCGETQDDGTVELRVVRTVQEDDPDWNCAEMGNRICRTVR
jgi:hypothetical protein